MADNKEWKLTEEHKRQIPEWNERWKKVALSCEEIDFAKTAQSVGAMYVAAKLPPPTHIVRANSAIEGAIIHAWAWAYYSLIEEAGISAS